MSRNCNCATTFVAKHLLPKLNALNANKYYFSKETEKRLRKASSYLFSQLIFKKEMHFVLRDKKISFV